MELSNWVGGVSGVLTAASMLPQLLKILSEKKADDISYGMLILLLVGIAGWILYGALKNDYPIIITNSFSFALNVVIMIFSNKYKTT